MTHGLGDARRWVQHGTELLLASIDVLDDASVSKASGLPGWDRRHLIAHVAANADALGNLVHWAATGVETPMYATLEARARGIEEGSSLPTDRLLAWTHSAARKLEQALDQLSDRQGTNSVVTAQGRTIPATQIPWLRAREVCVHAVDLNCGTTFADLPTDFLVALAHDVVTKHNSSPAVALRLSAGEAGLLLDVEGNNGPVSVSAPPAEMVAYLTGRAATLLTAGGSPAPPLPAWL